jgi:membrane protease YdiL (CAAX protease family)
LGKIGPQWHFLGALGPALATIALQGFQGKKGLLNLLRRLTRQHSWQWWLTGLSPLLLLGTALFFTLGITPQYKLLNPIGTSPLNIIIWLLPLLSYGIFEEIGWRGFLLPKLQEKYNALTSTFLLTTVWALWHIPMFFYRFQFNAFMATGFFVSLFLGAIILTHLLNRFRGNLLIVILWHSLWNMVATLDEKQLTPIMSVMIMLLALGIVIRYGSQNLAHQKRFQLKSV